MKKRFRWCFEGLGANFVKQHIYKMADEIENTVVSELNNCKLSVQLNESTCGVSAIFMMNVTYFNKMKGLDIDEFLFAKYLETEKRSDNF